MPKTLIVSATGDASDRGRLYRTLVLHWYTQWKASDATKLPGQCVLDPIHGLFDKYMVCALNSLYAVFFDKKFSLLLRNVSALERRLPRNIIVGLAVRSPIGLASLSVPGAQELYGMIYIFSTSDKRIQQRKLASRSVHNSPPSGRDLASRSIITLSPKAVLAVTPNSLAKHEEEASTLAILGESGLEGLSDEPVVDKPLSVEGPDTPSAELSEPSKVDEAYVDWGQAIDQYHIRC